MNLRIVMNILEFSNMCLLWLPHSMLRFFWWFLNHLSLKLTDHTWCSVRWTCLDCSEPGLSVDSISIQCIFFLPCLGRTIQWQGWWYWYFWVDVADMELPWGFQILFLSLLCSDMSLGKRAWQQSSAQPNQMPRKSSSGWNQDQEGPVQVLFRPIESSMIKIEVHGFHLCEWGTSNS